MKKIKIGQIGVCHEHASGKMNTMKLRPDLFEIVGVADDRASTAAKRAVDLNPYEGLPLMSEEELFRIPGLEAVTVEVPNLDLVPTAMRCLERNLPIHMARLRRIIIPSPRRGRQAEKRPAGRSRRRKTGWRRRYRL